MKLSDFPHLIYKTSTRADGNMSFKYGKRDDVLGNRKRFLADTKMQLTDCVMMAVEHEDKIEAVGQKDKGCGAFIREDAIVAETLVTSRKGVLLSLMTADCFPVAFYDPIHEIVALAHLGWKPTGLNLIQKTIAYLGERYKSAPEELVVSIGPGIHKESYVFDADVVAQKGDPNWEPFLDFRPDGKIGIDILGHVLQQLKDSRIIEENLEVSSVDTGTSPDYFSYYRATQEDRKKEIFMTVLGIRGDKFE